MKKIWKYLFIFLSVTTYGQKQKEYKWGCSVAMNSIQAQVGVPLMAGYGAVLIDADGNILAGGDRIDNSYSYSIIPKYYFNKDILLRFEFGITQLNLKANSDGKYFQTHEINTKDVKNKIYRYTPAFQWTFMKTKRLESYCGLSLSYVSYKTLNINTYTEIRDLTTDTLQYWTSSKESTPGGFAAGIGAFAGFSIYLHKHISLGAELSSAVLYYKLGGTSTGEESGLTVPDYYTRSTTTYVNSYKGFKISKIISSFNISVWF